MSGLQGFELIFYGDSITEDWRGTSGGMPWPIGSGTADVFYKHFDSKYDAEVLAIAGKPKQLHQSMNISSIRAWGPTLMTSSAASRRFNFAYAFGAHS